jgi:hypothetical protein
MVERPRAAQGMHMAPGQSLLFCPLGGGSSDSIVPSTLARSALVNSLRLHALVHCTEASLTLPSVSIHESYRLFHFLWSSSLTQPCALTIPKTPSLRTITMVAVRAALRTAMTRLAGSWIFSLAAYGSVSLFFSEVRRPECQRRQ